jgi:hypothetical protein
MVKVDLQLVDQLLLCLTRVEAAKQRHHLTQAAMAAVQPHVVVLALQHAQHA